MENKTTVAYSIDPRSLVEQMLQQLAEKKDITASAEKLSQMLEQLIASKTTTKQESRPIAKATEPPRCMEQAPQEELLSCLDLPMEWDDVFSDAPNTPTTYTESVSDALVLSLSQRARVDIPYISSVTGKDHKTVIEALRGSIYQNPDTWDECPERGWETAEEYLSGNLMRKWRAAKTAANLYKGRFEDNVQAIESVLPPTVATKDIYVTLGSPWVPTEVIDEFVSHILHLKGRLYSGTLHDELTGTWELPDKGLCQCRNIIASTSTYGTPRIGALYILERTLNMKTVCVTDEVPSRTSKSGKKHVINQEETLIALEKQQKLIAEFQKWVWQDERRKEKLETIFDNNFGCVRRRIFDGSFLTFPTMSPAVQLFPYQKNAVARILFSPNTLLAHDVGSGKTYVMIAAGMELKRMGLSRKNLYVVPNNIVGQWHTIFQSMYPAANLLRVEPKDFTVQKRRYTLEKIRDNDYDAIIMAYSCFDRIPLSKSYYVQELKKTQEEIHRIASQRRNITTGLRRKREAIERSLLDLLSEVDGMEQSVYFDELGITRLFVDEAHNYKNVPIDTKTDRVLGISAGGSQKCRDMMNKVRLIQSNNNGGGVVMATGTPITNSITDAFIMQKYLQSGELALLDLQSFDAWIGMFAEKVTEFEIDVDTNSYRLATRFSKFHNLPELTSLLSSIADFHQVDAGAGLPAFSGYEDAVIGKTEAFGKYLEDISARADRVRKGGVSVKEDNMLKITTDGRKAALDIRLVLPSSRFTYQSKVARCVERVFDIYQRTAPSKSVQLIFCDSSTPKAGFNLYDETKRLLVAMGIPDHEIAFVHDANTEAQRAKLFAKVRAGTVRVLIGSTFKLGLGVNVQDKLIALHHLDIPWRPADMIQREGRILRQGNENDAVHIYRYITEGSFDAYSWQLLETKQRFITGLLSGALSERSGSDIENTVLDYAEIKALAIGNPLIKKRVETANELTRCLSLQKTAIETYIRLERESMELPARIAQQRETIEKCKNDLVCYRNNKQEYDKETRRELREWIFAELQAHTLKPTERTLMTYRGFDVVLPAHMMPEKPYVWLQRNGRYYVEMSDTALGIPVRLDNCLDRLEEKLQAMRKDLARLQTRQEEVRRELLRKEDYTDIIEELKHKIERMDKKLGVKKS